MWTQVLPFIKIANSEHHCHGAGWWLMSSKSETWQKETSMLWNGVMMLIFPTIKVVTQKNAKHLGRLDDAKQRKKGDDLI